MALRPFNKPIPGMSLTTTPKNYPYERPPEINDPIVALKTHINRLSDPDRMEAVLFLLEDDNGITLKQLVTGIVRGAVANGVHSIDVGLLVAPAIHEFIKNTADAVGAEYDEGLEDKKGKGGLNMETMKPSKTAYEVADAILSGNYESPVGDATHYYNPAVATPDWGREAGGDWLTIGNHIFGYGN